MAESLASGPLHKLQSELTGAKSQWEYLHDRITNGYKDAYKLHVGALQEMKQARLLEEQREARVRGYFLFVSSVVAVGFAGGFVGGLIAPWTKKASDIGADLAIREGVRGLATRSTQQIAKLLIPQESTKPSADESQYVPVSPDPIDVYLDQKEELDGCFAIVNSWLQHVIDMSNAGQWSADSGSTILDNFRKNCRLLADAPDPNQLPERRAVAKSAEILMWVAWANVRDWAYWNKLYDLLENTSDHLDKWQLDGVNAEFELAPVLNRLQALGIQGVDRSERIGSTIAQSVLDLRKLRSLPVQALPTLPFTKMKGLNLYGMDSLQIRGQFLDGLRELRPFHVR
jgi:hypothetical protein